MRFLSRGCEGSFGKSRTLMEHLDSCKSSLFVAMLDSRALRTYIPHLQVLGASSGSQRSDFLRSPRRSLWLQRRFGAEVRFHPHLKPDDFLTGLLPVSAALNSPVDPRPPTIT